MLRIKLKTAIFAVIIFSCGSACSDIIYFKDGSMVEGVTRQEDDKSVVIDLGAGTMTVRTDEINHIKKASFEDNEKLKREKLAGKITQEGRASLGCEEIRMAYLKAKASRETFKKARNSSLLYKDDISRKKTIISELLSALDEKSRELKTIDSDKRTKEYNIVVADINSINARLNAEDIELNNLYAGEKEAAAAMAEKANKYRANFKTFKDELNERRHSETGVEIGGDKISFFEEMDAKIAEMESDFKKNSADYTSEDNQIIVDAVINGRAFARLVVDTGASIIVISKNIADRLNMEDQNIDADIEILMADGTSVNAKPVILKSVKVGDAEVENVQAAVLENSVIGGADGLLGMSFLSNFVISIDTSTSKLILEH